MKLNPIFKTIIKPEWLDYNKHMNVAYYVLVFDLAGEVLVNQLGMGEAYSVETGISWMVLENHITYNAEVNQDDEVEVIVQLIDYDEKRLHLYFEMYQTKDQRYLASTLEQMFMCVDLNTRRSAVFPKDIHQKIITLFDSQSTLKPSENLGRIIGIKRKKSFIN